MLRSASRPRNWGRLSRQRCRVETIIGFGGTFLFYAGIFLLRPTDSFSGRRQGLIDSFLRSLLSGELAPFKRMIGFPMSIHFAYLFPLHRSGTFIVTIGAGCY